MTALAIPPLLALRRLTNPENQQADLLQPDTEAGADGTCPAGLPRDTGVESIPVVTLTGPDS